MAWHLCEMTQLLPSLSLGEQLFVMEGMLLAMGIGQFTIDAVGFPCCISQLNRCPLCAMGPKSTYGDAEFHL